MDRAVTKVGAESRSIEEEMLSALSDQTTAEKSTSKTASDTSELRRKIRTEELAVVETENELAKLQVRAAGGGGGVLGRVEALVERSLGR